jgi:putative flippase GtrA
MRAQAVAPFLRFSIVGATNTTLTLLTYALLLRAGLWYAAASVIGVGVGMVNGYTWNRLWTFRTSGPVAPQLARYVVVSLAGMAVSVGLLALLVEELDVGAFVAQVLALPAVVAVTFSANRRWTFPAT